MIELVNGAIYSIDEEDLSQEILEAFCTREHKDGVICVTQKEKGIKTYINAADIRQHRIDKNCYEVVQENLFSKEEWDFENIFVATEDAVALGKMQAAFGDRVKYVDQKRFVLQKGEYLSQQKEKDTWKPGDGWKYGADYLCAMVLLSECGFFIASGGCTGTGLVQKLAKDKQRRSYIFDLGLYE